MTRHRPGLRPLYRWHRYLGLLVVALVPLLTLSGIALNHTQTLRLDQRELHQPWLLSWYGIVPEEGRFFPVGNQWLSQWGERLYLDDNELSQRAGPLVAAVRMPTLIVAATSDELLLLGLKGELLELLDHLDGIPSGIRALSSGADGQLRMETTTGTEEMVLELEQGEWQTVLAAPPPTDGPPPERLLRLLQQQNRGPAISLERLVLDLHSGRLLGAWGVYLMDGAALLLLFNALSGALIWWRRRRQQHSITRRCPGGTSHHL